jgi:hypothetical protein
VNPIVRLKRRNRKRPGNFGAFIYSAPVGIAAPAVRETAGMSDRLSYSLLEALNPTLRETAGFSDRLTYSLSQSISVTMREVLGVEDRLSGALITAISRTIRELLGVTDGGAALGQQQSNQGPNTIILYHAEFREGREGFSGHRVVAPSHTHEARVINFGSVEKEVEIPSGPPRFSDVNIELDDNPDPVTGVQYFRSKFGTRTPRMTKGDILVGQVGGKEHLFEKPAKFIHTGVTFPPGRARVQGSDQRFRVFDKPLPGLINHKDFASQVNLPPGLTDAFAPIVYGNVSSVGYGDQGAIEAIYVDTVRLWYVVARHSIRSVTVYRKRADEAVFTVVETGWQLVYFEFFIDERHHTFSLLQFDEDQEDAIIRCDVEGLDERGPWGTLPSFADSTSRNPVDHTIAALFYARQKAGLHLGNGDTDFSDFDTASFAEVYQKCVDLNYLSDFAVTQPLTSQEVLTQLHAPFQIHLIPDRFDRLKLVLITDADLENAPEIDDFNSIILRSELISLASPTANRYRYRFAYKPADGQWGAEKTFDNLADQDALGEVEELLIDMHSVRDEDVAAACIAERSRWESHDAHRIRFDVDMASHLPLIDLLKPIKVTHGGGLEEGGWIQQLFIPFAVRYNLDEYVINVDAIRRPIIALPAPQFHIGNWPWNHRGGPEYVLQKKRLYQCFRDNRGSDNKMVVLGSNTAGQMVPVDDGIYPALANVIRSSDSVWSGPNDVFTGPRLHMVTQEENTGRVGYTRFNGATYEVLNQTILSGNSHGDCGVTIAVQEPSGKVTVIMYGDQEFSTGFPASPASGPAGFYRRAYITQLTGTTWSAPVMLGDPSTLFAATIWFPIWGDPHYNSAVHINVGRAIHGKDNRIHHVYSVNEPGDVANTPDFYIQTLRTDGSLSAAFEWKFTGGGGNSAVFLCGDPCTIEDDDDQLWIAMPVGELNEPKIVMWKDKDNPTAPDKIILLAAPPVEVPPDTFGSRCPGIGVRALNGELHVVHATRQTGQEEWAAYKTIAQPFASAEADPEYTTGPRDVQCGARWPATTYGGHGFDIKKLTDGNTYIFKATGGTQGVPGVPDVDHILERLNVADLPTDYTLAEFVAANP